MPVVINGQTYYRTLEVCKKTGLSRATLFRWFKEGIIEEPRRDRRGWKLFDEDDLKKIQAEVNRTHKQRRLPLRST